MKTRYITHTRARAHTRTHTRARADTHQPSIDNSGRATSADSVSHGVACGTALRVRACQRARTQRGPEHGARSEASTPHTEEHPLRTHRRCVRNGGAAASHTRPASPRKRGRCARGSPLSKPARRDVGESSPACARRPQVDRPKASGRAVLLRRRGMCARESLRHRER